MRNGATKQIPFGNDNKKSKGHYSKKAQSN